MTILAILIYSPSITTFIGYKRSLQYSRKSSAVKYFFISFKVIFSTTSVSNEYEKHGFSLYNLNPSSAHVMGSSYASGNWGVKKNETALVGELGTEVLVRHGKYTTLGDNGAEFVNLRAGDIIFNHKQSEELFKY